MMRLLFAALVALLLSACAIEPQSVVTQPVTARPQPALATGQNQGAIFQAETARNLFEERVARRVGDTLMVTIQERITASNKSESGADRTGTAGVSASGNLPFVSSSIEKFLFPSGGFDVSSTGTYSGAGDTSNQNSFTSTMSVTVVEVLANGNLVVGGERQISINGQVNTMRLTGVVNPNDIQAGNTIPSTRIADARVEQVGRGYIQDANTMGWLQRFFLTVMPF
ncbi:flagellar basal body L-ring protein FlgH [Chitinibacteraceae bacterium HSL-7]